MKFLVVMNNKIKTGADIEPTFKILINKAIIKILELHY